MKRKYFYLILLLPLFITSCIVGTEVAVINKSKTDKNITVHYPADFRFPVSIKGNGKDSLNAYDISKTENAITTRDYYRYPVKVHISSLDTLNRTYSFTLKTGYKLILQDVYPTVTPAFGQVFIIDNTDTVMFDRSRKFFKKSPKMGKGGSWKYTITDD